MVNAQNFLTSFSHDAELLEFFHLNDSTQTIAPLLTPFPLDFLQKKDLSQFQNTHPFKLITKILFYFTRFPWLMAS